MTKEIISDLSTPEEVKAAYEKMGVKTARISGLNDKFMTVPEKFEVFGLIPKDVTINGRTMQNIPAFSIDKEGDQFVLVGSFLSQYSDRTTASKITREGANYGKFLIANNRRVHPFTEGLSEAELVIKVLKIKHFISNPAQDFDVFQPEYVDNKPQFPDTEAEAFKRVITKSYRVIYPAD